VRFAAITLFVDSQRVFIVVVVVVYYVIDSVRKLLDTLSSVDLHLAQDKDKQRVLVNMVMKRQVPYKAG
jgi:hypothetical protein